MEPLETLGRLHKLAYGTCICISDPHMTCSPLHGAFQTILRNAYGIARKPQKPRTSPLGWKLSQSLYYRYIASSLPRVKSHLSCIGLSFASSLALYAVSSLAMRAEDIATLDTRIVLPFKNALYAPSIFYDFELFCQPSTLTPLTFKSCKLRILVPFSIHVSRLH